MYTRCLLLIDLRCSFINKVNERRILGALKNDVEDLSARLSIDHDRIGGRPEGNRLRQFSCCVVPFPLTSTNDGELNAASVSSVNYQARKGKLVERFPIARLPSD